MQVWPAAAGGAVLDAPLAEELHHPGAELQADAGALGGRGQVSVPRHAPRVTCHVSRVMSDRFPEDNVSDTSSRDYPRLYLESDYGQRTDRENDLDTDLERADKEREKRGSSRSGCLYHTANILVNVIFNYLN